MEKQQGVQQQRTIIPASVHTQAQGINAPQRPMARPGVRDPQAAQRKLDAQMSAHEDSIPAILRQGEEVIPPEVIAKMGGRDAFLSTLNERLAPTGIRLHGGKGPVNGGQAEGDTLDGTIRPMDDGAMDQPASQPQMAQGPQGIRFGMAKGGQVQLSTQPTAYTGGMLTNQREPQPSKIQYNPRQKMATGTTATPVSTATRPAQTGPQAATVDSSTKGIGFTPTDVTQSSLYKTQAQSTDEAIQKQGAVTGMQAAQTQAQAGIPQSSAAARTANAQNTANTESNIAKANTQLAQTAQQEQQSNLQQTMQLAYQSGDWGAVNKALSAMGQSPIDFTNLEQQRQSGNLTAASQTLFNLANSITGTDAASTATKQALSTEATGLLSTGLTPTLGAQYNPEALTAAVSNISNGNISDPATATFVNHVASAPLTWIQSSQSGQLFAQSIEQNAAGKQLLTQANAGDTNAIQQLAYISTLAASNDSGVQLNPDQIAVLKQYGVYFDYSAVNAANKEQNESASVATAAGSSYV